MARAKSPRRRGAATRAEAYPGRVRIIAGHWRSRLLDVTAVDGLRPTPDRVRGTLFNWLAPYLEGARCLDLFAGTGALCLEALSRGAAAAVMVERSPAAAEQLRRNVARLEARTAEVVNAEALAFLAGPPRIFDIVFLDPPFAIASDMFPSCSVRLAAGWVRSGSLVYTEASRDLPSLSLPSHWRPLKEGEAGQVAYALFQVA